MDMLHVTTLILLYVYSFGTEIRTERVCANICRTQRIVGGCPANIKDHPYQISLEHVYRGQFCSGSIINKLWVVTAAHCLEAFDLKKMRVRAGSSYKEEGGSVRRVSATIIHPKYKNYDYDIGVIKVSRPFRFGQSIKPIEMTKTPPDVDTCVIVSGWGDLSEGGQSSARLHHVEVLIIDYKRCLSSYKSLTARMICAGWPEGGKDACQMDSGGPLVTQDNKLVGIVSWGYGCAQKGYPGVYTSVSALRNWVMSHVGYLKH